MPLYALSLAYLYLPLVLFVAGWLRPPLAAGICLLLLAAFRSLRGRLAERETIGRRTVAMAAALAIGWTAFSGAGGFGHRSTDAPKHEAVLKGLVMESWPVVYEMTAPGLEGDRHALVYYIAYYLPAGAVGKVLGWKAANVGLALWTAAGAFLTLLWVVRLLEAPRFALGAAFFVFASGLDAVGFLIVAGRSFGWAEHLEWWAGYWIWQYSSNTTLLFWVPQQALGGWIATALLLDGLVSGRMKRSASEAATASPSSAASAGVELAGALFWSPFAFLGAIPFALLRVARAPRELLRAWPATVAAVVVGGVLTTYFAALRHDRIPSRFVGERLFGDLAPLFLLFVVLEFGLFWVLSRPRADGTGWRAVWRIAGASLLLIPFYRVGEYNDFVMRASIPALFALWIVVGRALFDPAVERWRRAALAALVVVGSLTPTMEIARSAAHYGIRIRPLERIPALPVAHPNMALASQYVGPPDAPFFRYLARMRTPESR